MDVLLKRRLKKRSLTAECYEPQRYLPGSAVKRKQTPAATAVLKVAIKQTDQLFQSQTKHLSMRELEEKAASERKQVVCCSFGYHKKPGNVAYTKRICDMHLEYLQSVDEPHRESVFQSFMEKFDFQRPADASNESWEEAPVSWLRDRVTRALRETRRLHRPCVEKDSARRLS
jgi:hypothetical protein